MYILKIIPIAKGLPEDYFSYFSKEKLTIGALVEIKIRNRKIFGLIREITEAKKEKINLKTQNFSLKKIERIVKDNFIKEKVFTSILESSTLLGARDSEILESYLPEFIFDNLHILDKSNKENNKKLKNTKSYIVENLDTRLDSYIDITRLAVKNNSSSVIFFPTISDLEFAKNYFLEKSSKYKDLSEEKILTLHSQNSKKDTDVNIKKLVNNKSLIILSTPSILPFILKEYINLANVIIEKENSFNYFSHSAKRQIDARKLIEKLAVDLRLQLTIGGNTLSLDTYKYAEGKIKISKRKSKLQILDLRIDKLKAEEEILTRTKKIIKKEDAHSKYSEVYFSPVLIDKLEKIKKNGTGKVFLYSKRKGLYTETVCSDCNTIFTCDECDKPYTLFKKDANGDRVYICLSCKNKISLHKKDNFTCKNCGSWRMQTLGVGVEGIEDNLKNIGWNTYLLDSQNVKTKKEAIKIIDSWQKSKAGVLIGTDLALNFLNRDMNIDLAAIISIDSLFSIPEISIDEKIINLSLDIEEKCAKAKDIIIETRLREQEIWDYVENGDLEKFLTDELVMRQTLSLPPYSNILKFKVEKKNLKIKNNLEKLLAQIFKEEKIEPVSINWRLEKKSEAHIGTIIIDKKYWEIKKEGITLPTEFAKKIHTLLADFRLEINPTNIY